jgi:diguanylate cyclase (GGDEF)-like protein
LRTDELTGLPDRRSCDGVLERSLIPAEQPVCVVLLDFDRCDDSPPAGIEMLLAAAQAWSEQLRPGDVLARYGGEEEFAVLLRRCDEIAALAIAERLRLATPGARTVSVGVAQWDGAESAASLVCRADEGLFRARRHGRDRVALAR